MQQSGVTVVDVILPLEQSEDEQVWLKAAARKLKVPKSRVKELRLRKHSIDARKPQIKVNLRLEVGVDQALPDELPLTADYPQVPDRAKRVLIVGCGPAGLFAALKCIQRAVSYTHLTLPTTPYV